MKIIRSDDNSFESEFKRIVQRGNVFDESIVKVVKDIVDDIATRKDEALFEYTEKLDGCPINAGSVEVTQSEIETALSKVDEEDLTILKTVVSRVEAFHRKQKVESWIYIDEDGIELGQRLIPLERIGIYAPGGLASYPSTVIMAAIPAKIAGVEEIILVSPAKEGKINPMVVAAAVFSGVNRIFKIGGAQAIAALAFGTESIPRVDKIVGPGNAYVSAAKKMVYGHVDIDMIAGPSEVIVIADETANPGFIAADMLAQAEHDEMASAVLITANEDIAQLVIVEINRQLANLKRKSIAARSLECFGGVFLANDLDEAISIANRFAPEHLELMVKNTKDTLSKIKHAGAVFLGSNTPEAVGDYIAGPNHILPTGGTARFASALGVYDFIKRISVLSFTEDSLKRYGRQVVRLAQMEGLEAHGKSVAIRLERKKS